MEHAGEIGVQFSFGSEMEAYGGQAASESTQFCYKSYTLSIYIIYLTLLAWHICCRG